MTIFLYDLSLSREKLKRRERFNSTRARAHGCSIHRFRTRSVAPIRSDRHPVTRDDLKHRFLPPPLASVSFSRELVRDIVVIAIATERVRSLSVLFLDASRRSIDRSIDPSPRREKSRREEQAVKRAQREPSRASLKSRAALSASPHPPVSPFAALAARSKEGKTSVGRLGSGRRVDSSVSREPCVQREDRQWGPFQDESAGNRGNLTAKGRAGRGIRMLVCN